MNDLNTKKIINHIRCYAALILSHTCMILSEVCNDKHLSILWVISAVFHLVVGVFMGRNTKQNK